MELAEMLTSILPVLDKAKEFLENETGFRRSNLALAEASESKDGQRWIITFFYNFPNQESYCEVEVSKKNGEMLAFRRLESDQEAPENTQAT